MAGLDDIFGGRPASQIPGTRNPFTPPNLDYLRDPSKFGFLQNLAPNYKTIDNNDPMFTELLSRINAPSSVDQVQSGIDSQTMDQLLKGIGIDSKNSAGSIKSDFLDRGLGGPGQISDIEANALSQNESDANRNRTGARLGFANQELTRLKNKENQAVGAYTDRYDTTNKNMSTDAQTYNDLLKSGNLAYGSTLADRDKSWAQIMSDLYTGGAANQTKGYIPRQNSIAEDLLRNVNLGISF